MGLGADLLNGGPVDAGEDNGSSDVARIKGRGPDPWQQEFPITSTATSLTSHAERNPSGWGTVNLVG